MKNFYRIPVDENGFAEPWKMKGASLTNAKLNMRNPIDSNGNPRNYVRLMFAVAEMNYSSKKWIAESLGLEAKTSYRWKWDKEANRYVQGPAYIRYNWNSYFLLLRDTGIINYDVKRNEWSIGNKFGTYLAEVIMPACRKTGVSITQLIERSNLK